MIQQLSISDRDPQRLPRGAECQCMEETCGLFFTAESAFKKHWTKAGHVHPSKAGLVEKTRANGPVWGLPGENPRFTKEGAA